jgi:methionyl-tRNA formyltransferase
MNAPSSNGARSADRPERPANVAPADTAGALRRIVIFTSQRSYSVCKGVVALSRRFPHVEWLIVEERPQRKLSRLLRNQFRNLRRNGLRWIPHQIADLSHSLRRRVLGGTPAASAPGGAYSFEYLNTHPKIRIASVADIHSAESVARVHDFRADLGVSLAAPILRQPLFAAPRLGTINLHKGKLPDYRGMPPAFWEMFRGESGIGCTIHRVDAGLDSGDVLCSGSVPRAAHSTVRGLQIALDELGIDLMCEALLHIDGGDARALSQSSGGQLYRKPTLKQVAELRTRLAGRRDESRLRAIGKALFFWVYVNARMLQRVWLGLCGRQRVVVLLYHRVNDDMRDNVTVGVEEFERQMEWLGTFATVVRIEDVVTGRIDRYGVRPIVAVTFDDGYADNYTTALPILERHRVPAAFFITTSLVGTAIGFEHDLEKKGEVVPTMSWAQVSDLRDRGFSVGSHTATHIDCGTADLSVVRAELLASRDELQRRFGLSEIVFAYPFGRRHNMTERARAVVREAGYLGCLSAYGGCNAGRIDPNNILRLPINCSCTFGAFRARVEGFG